MKIIRHLVLTGYNTDWTVKYENRIKVSKSRKENMLSQILQKNERWGIFQYIKMPQRSFFWRI